MGKTRLYLLCLAWGIAALHAASYVIEAGVNRDAVQRTEGGARLILVLLLGAASLTYEVSRRRTSGTAHARPDLLVPSLWLAAALLYALTAWPTVYRGWWGEDGYDYRTNRLTGTTQWKCDFDWKPVTTGTTLPRPYRSYP